jgi:tetratricopeptide (TPR) repeat protein
LTKVNIFNNIKDGMNNNFFNKAFLVFSLILIFFSIGIILYSIYTNTVNIQIIVRNATVIIFFIGIIFFYYFYENRILLHTSYFLLLLNIGLSIFRIINDQNIVNIIYIVCSIYMFVSINKYLYSISDILIYNILSKILFFNKKIKRKLALLYYENKIYDKSINILKHLNDVESLYLLASNYENIKDENLAIKTYSKIILEDNRERPDILYNRGALYKNIGKYDEAIIDFNNCLKCNEPDPKAFIALGVIMDEIGEYEKAKELFKKGNKLDKSFKEYIPEKYK